MSISVVVPNYNYARLLGRRVNSILNQTHPIDEIIFLDDCSTDNSLEVIDEEIKKIKERKPDIKIKKIINKENSGSVCKQWAKGFKAASSDYVWIAEVDDLAEKSFLEKAIAPFKKDDDILISYTESVVVDPKNKPLFKRNLRRTLEKKRLGHWTKSYTVDGKKEIQDVMCIYNTIPNVSAAVFKNDSRYENILEKAAGFSIAGDWYFYVQLLLIGKISYVNEKLNRYCVHHDSVTKTTDKRKYLDETKEMHRIISEAVELTAKSKKNLIKQEQYLERIWGLE